MLTRTTRKFLGAAAGPAGMIRPMRRVTSRVVALAWVLLAAAPGAAQPADWTGLEQALSDAVAAGEVPGAVLVLGQGDTVLYRKAVGSRALVPRVEPISLDTVYDV